MSPAFTKLMLHLRAVIARHMQAPEAKGLHHVLLVFSNDGRSPALVGISTDLDKFEKIEDGVLNTMASIRAQVEAGNLPPGATSTGSEGDGQSN